MKEDTMHTSNKDRNTFRWLVFVFLCNAACFAYCVYFLGKNGYLPNPFFYDKSDTFMDLFNTLHWAYDDGRYTEWGSIYPPLNFIFLRALGFLFSGVDHGTAAFMREQSSFVIAGLGLIYLTVPAFVLKTKCWQNFPNTRVEKALLYCAIILSPPMLFALERGNLILLAPVLLALTISTHGIRRCICIALLINLKPYFVLLMLFYVARKNFKELSICVAFSGLIFLVTGIFLDTHFFLFFSNLLNFSHANGIFSLREMMAMPSSVSAFSYVLKTPAAIAQLSGHVDPTLISIGVSLIEAAKWMSLALALGIVFAKVSVMRDAEIFAVLVVLISNLGVWVGGYTLILYVVFIPIFILLRTQKLVIGLLLLIALPFDLVPLIRESIGVQYSFLSNSYLSINWSLGFGSVIRPIANIVLLWVLAWEFFVRSPLISTNQN
jgi:hypothetical protein